MSELVIRETRLPDIDDSEDRGLASYGRFARLRSGLLWFGDARSSHPSTTEVGWYWAFDMEGSLLVSARGSRLDTDILFVGDKSILAWLLDELEKRGFIKKPDLVRIER